MKTASTDAVISTYDVHISTIVFPESYNLSLPKALDIFVAITITGRHYSLQGPDNATLLQAASTTILRRVGLALAAVEKMWSVMKVDAAVWTFV